MAYKYFLYSADQLEFRTKTELKTGKTFRVGMVFHRGKKRNFTELSSTPTNHYTDSKIVAEGEETSFKFTLPGGV